MERESAVPFLFVTPVCNEEGDIAPFLERLETVLTSLEGAHEIIFSVDDGSQDASWSENRRLAEIYAALRAFRFDPLFMENGIGRALSFATLSVPKKT